MQFLKGQKVFALTDGRLFWRKEGQSWILLAKCWSFSVLLVECKPQLTSASLFA